MRRHLVFLHRQFRQRDEARIAMVVPEATQVDGKIWIGGDNEYQVDVATGKWTTVDYLKGQPAGAKRFWMAGLMPSWAAIDEARAAVARVLGRRRRYACRSTGTGRHHRGRKHWRATRAGTDRQKEIRTKRRRFLRR